MFYRILTKNGVDNTNIDGARNYNFNAGRRSGIVKGALNQGNFFTISNNTIVLDTCELRLCGHRIVIDEAKSISFHNQPSVPIRYSLVAQIIVDNDGGVSFDLHAQTSSTALVQDNLDTNGSGTYELEIGRFTQLTDGTLTDVVRTADLITGGGNNDSEYIRIGTVTTNKISPELDADVDIENTINPDDNKPQTNFTFNLPTSVGTVVSVNGEEKTSINTDITPIASSENLITSGGVHDYPSVTFAESERQKSKNLFNINKVEFKAGSEAFSTLSNGTITINAGNGFCYISSLTNLCNLKPNIPYTLSYVTSNGRSYIYQYNSINTGFNWSNGETKIFTQEELNKISDNLLLFYGSDTEAATYSNIQIEEGSVATDYQPYNGAIVHEKDIKPILIYDIVEKQTPTGLTSAYSSGIKFADGVNIPIGDFNYFNIYTRTKNNVKKKTTINKTYYYWGDSFFGFNENWVLSYFGVLFIIENNSLGMAETGYTAINTSTYTSKNQSEDVVVYRIEGGY